MVGFIGGPKKALSRMKKTFPALAAAQRAKKPVGTAKPVGALKNPIGAGGMAKMPTTGGAARRPVMSRIQKPMMKKGGAVKKGKK